MGGAVSERPFASRGWWIWVGNISYVPVIGGFVYVAIVLDAWSRRVVGYALSRSIDVRLTLAALGAAVTGRKPAPGCVHHSDRGSPNMPPRLTAMSSQPKG